MLIGSKNWAVLKIKTWCKVANQLVIEQISGNKAA
jgi:hypothetical protein